MSELTDRRDAAARQQIALLQRRRDIRQRTTALKQGCRTILSRPSTLAAAFLAGGLLGFRSPGNKPRRAHDSSPAGQVSEGNRAKLWASLQPLIIDSISRSIVRSLILSRPPPRADSPPSGPGQGARREEPSR